MLMSAEIHDIALAVAAIAGAVGAAISGGNNYRLEKLKKTQNELTILVDSGVKQQLDTHLVAFTKHLDDDADRHDETIRRLSHQDIVLDEMGRYMVTGGIFMKEVDKNSGRLDHLEENEGKATQALAEEKERTGLMTCAAHGCDLLAEDQGKRGCPVIAISNEGVIETTTPKPFDPDTDTWD